jgi:hypothetical protein
MMSLAFVLEWWWAILGVIAMAAGGFINHDYGKRMYELEYVSPDDGDPSEIQELITVVVGERIFRRKVFEYTMMWLGLITFILAGILVTLLKENS